MSNSTGKTVVVTGATRGLGRAMVDRFVEEGHTVIGCGRSEASIAELSQAYPEPHFFHPVDVSNDRQVADWAAQVLDRLSPPDLLINNAALINRNAPLWEIPADEFAELTAVNVNGVVSVIRHFVPAMIEQGHGIVVNFSSGWGRSTSADVAPYCASKWAIEGLTQALAQELPSGLAAIPLNPGIINTEMLQSCFGPSASSFPDAEAWSDRAVPFLLSLSPRDNGASLTVPG